MPAAPKPRPAPPRPQWIEIAGFKALREPARLALRPLTLIAGANSGGKSSAMQPLLLLKQTFEANFDPGPLLLNGPHVQFTELSQLLSRGARRDDAAAELSLTFGPPVAGPRAQAAARVSPKSPVRLSFGAAPGKRASPFALAPARVQQRGPDRWVEVHAGMSVEDVAELLHAHQPKLAAAARASSAALQVAQYRAQGSALPSLLLSPREGRPATIDPPQLRPLLLEPMAAHAQFIRAILHLPGLRGHRERRYSTAQVSVQDGVIVAPGPFTPYAASLLAQWQDEGDARLQHVHAGLQALGLTSTVVAARVNAAELELKVGRLPTAHPSGASDLIDIADVGFGVSQVLPVVVALAAAAPGQLVYVEQPELHLHPRAQRAIGRLLAEAAARGVCVVAETHSRLVLRAAQIALARGVLRPDAVGLHWFCRDPESGFSEVALAELDERGTFGDWPVDFSETEAEADDEWLELALGPAAR